MKNKIDYRFLYYLMSFLIFLQIVQIAIADHGGYEGILKDNMIEAGMLELEADEALSFPRKIEDVVTFDTKSGRYFVPDTTFAFIADDAMSGYTLKIEDTLWFNKLFDLWEVIKK